LGRIGVRSVPVSGRSHGGGDEVLHFVEPRADGGVEHFEGRAEFLPRSIGDEVLHFVEPHADGGVEHFEGRAEVLPRSIVPTLLSTSMGLDL
jgi:hypothetical protein